MIPSERNPETTSGWANDREVWNSHSYCSATTFRHRNAWPRRRKSQSPGFCVEQSGIILAANIVGSSGVIRKHREQHRTRREGNYEHGTYDSVPEPSECWSAEGRLLVICQRYPDTQPFLSSHIFTIWVRRTYPSRIRARKGQ